MRRSFWLSRRACWEPTDWRSSASSRSSRAVASRPARPAMIAASLSALASWAPVIPVVLRATSVRSRSAPSGLPLAWERRIASRPLRSGGATSTVAGAADGVELVDEDHRAPRLARLLEEAANAGGATADEHLDEAG